MSSTLNDTMGAAKNVMETAKHGTEHAVSSARSTVLDGVKAVAGIVTMLRGFEVDDGLGWFGLARRRTPLVSFATFGAGVALGAGLGVLFAPMSGAAMRRAILKQINGLTSEAKETFERAESEVKEVGEKVGDKAEELAGKAKDAVKKAERKVENKVSDGAEAVKDAVKSRVDAVKDTVEDAKSAIYSSTDAHHNDPNRPAKQQTGMGPGHRLS